MSFEIEGTLVKKFDTESKTNSFQTREFVITTEGTYPQFVKFQLTQDKCQAIDDYQENDRIKVYFDLRGREWQGKYFTNLNAWKVEKSGQSKAVGGESFPDFTQAPPEFQTANPFEDNKKEDFDDLPF
jgi:single-strand DNA-binding protein